MTDIDALNGSAGHFTVRLREHPRYVDMDKCIACGICAAKCPRKADDEHNEGLSKRKAAYIKYPQAVPLKYVIDKDNCIYFEKGKCRACEKFCPAGAIDFGQRERVFTIDVGSIILTMGSEPADPFSCREYGYGRFPNVITSMEFERILSSSGPFEGHLVRPSDKSPPKKIAWIQCVGSRDTHPGAHSYCSGVCCMVGIKEAVIAKEHCGKGLETAIFFIDMRSSGKDFERYYTRAKEQMGVRFVRSRIHSIETAAPGSNDLKLVYVDESGRTQDEIFDLVVLSVGLQVPRYIQELALKLGVHLDSDGFAKTSCLNPVATSRKGVFVCGTFGGPKDIPQSVMEASAASSASAALLVKARHTMTQEKTYPPEEAVKIDEPRIGVFVCHCGINIGSIVDVPQVREYAKNLPGVVYATDNLFTCSHDTQKVIREVIKEKNLNRVVVAACSPRTHESLFQETIREAGLNPYLLEFTNVRDQDAWVHKEAPEEATQKAKDLVRMAVSKAVFSEPIQPLHLELTRSAMIIGGGIAGMNAALSLADQGIHAYLIEHDEELGGYAKNIKHTWKGEDVTSYIAGLCDRVREHPNIEVLLGAQIKDVKGFVGNFITTVLVNGNQQKLKHGVAILATGAQPLETEEYGFGRYDRVTTWHELEQLFEKDPKLLQESDAIAFIQCVGSRESKRAYCSKICCISSVQQAIALKTKKPELEVYILYRDMRTHGQREELYRKARELGVLFIRYTLEQKPKVEIAQVNGKEKLKIIVRDITLDLPIAFYVDYLNLFTAIVSEEKEALANLFKVPLNDDGFFLEAHAKLRPVDFSTDGVFVCGMAHYPKPIEESIAQAQAAAARAANVLAKEYVEVEPIVSDVEQDKCIGCGLCEASCPFGAIQLIDVPGKGLRAENISALCKGCGVCAANCPQKAIDMRHFRDQQIIAAIQAGGESALDVKHLAKPITLPKYFVVSGYRLADDYYYHSGHSWAHMEKGGRLKIGVDDFMVKILGQADSLKLPVEGTTLRQGRTGWLFTRDGHRAEILSPLTGKVFAVNDEAVENPELVYADPYQKGWIFILEPIVPKLDLENLFFGSGSIQWMEKENKKLLQLLGPEFERLAATGGKPVADLFGHFPEIGWDRLVKTFFRAES
jgi:heterodisulfide reductase subunit A